MNEFTASNGVRIRNSEGQITWAAPESDTFGVLNGYVVGSLLDVALTEAYRKGEDIRLGRWRWPDDPDYVVYPSDQVTGGSPYGWARVLHEPTSFVEDVCRHPGMLGATRADFRFRDAGRAYFDVHPEPKPWHDAQPGEVWVLTLSEAGGASQLPWTFSDDGYFTTPASVNFIKAYDTTITLGRRIWPEASE